MTTITAVFSILVALFTLGGVYYASKAVEPAKGAPIEKSMGVILVAFNLIAGIAALIFSQTAPLVAEIISIAMLAVLVVLQLVNKQGSKRAWSWVCFAGIYTIALAFVIAGMLDSMKFDPRQLLWFLLVAAVILAGIFRVKTYGRERKPRRKILDGGEILAIAFLSVLFVGLIFGIVVVARTLA